MSRRRHLALALCLLTLSLPAAATHTPSDERVLDAGEMTCTSGGPTSAAKEPVVFTWHDNGKIHLEARGVNAWSGVACTFAVVFEGARLLNDPHEVQPWGADVESATPCSNVGFSTCTASLTVSWWFEFWDLLHTSCAGAPDPVWWRLKPIEVSFSFTVNGQIRVGGIHQAIVYTSCLGVAPPTPCEKVADRWVCPNT